MKIQPATRPSITTAQGGIQRMSLTAFLYTGYSIAPRRMPVISMLHAGKAKSIASVM